jgi:hypothetical protein
VHRKEVQLTEGTPCGDAIKQALEKAREIVSGQLAPIEGAKWIAWTGTADCYDFLHEDVEVVDEMAGFTAFVDDWEIRQDSKSAREEISQEIREAAATLLEQFK